MKPLTATQKREITAYDAIMPIRQNKTRIYKYLVPNKDDVEVRTVAVKNRKGGAAVVKEIGRASARSSRIRIKDVALSFIAGYAVDWSPEKLGPEKPWSYEGKWGIVKYNRRNRSWKFTSAQIVNPEAVKGSPAFRWCAYTDDCGEVTDYLKAYLQHPKAELLAKAGAGHLTKSTAFLASLEKNPAFAKFVARNIEGIAKCRASIPNIRKAFATGKTVEAVQTAYENAAFLREYGIRAVLDTEKVIAYLDANGIHAEAYSRYLDDLATLGKNLADTKNAYPKNFAARADITMQKAECRRRRMDKAKKRRLDARIRAVAKMLSQAEQTPGLFVVRFPRNELDLIREGRALSHCVGDGTWAARIADEKTFVAFIRKPTEPDTPFVTVAFDAKTHQIDSCYAHHNSRPDAEVRDFVHGPFKTALDLTTKTA